MADVVVQHPDLAGKSVLITGGATGIGAALTAAFAAQGARVFFIDIADDPGRELAAKLSRSSPHPVTFLHADLRQVAETRAAVDEAARAAGSLSVLVNNAGWDDRHDVDTVSEAYWDESQAINLKQMFLPRRQPCRTCARRPALPSSISPRSPTCSTWATCRPMRRPRPASSD